MALAVLSIDINAKLANIERDLGKVSHLAEQSGKRMDVAFSAAKAAFLGMASAFSVGTIVDAIKHTIDLGDEMGDLSQRIGVSVESLATWTLAANQSGTSIESVARGIKGLAEYMTLYSDRLKSVGVTSTDANGALIQLADIFKEMPDGITKTALAVKIFGKAGMEMIPLLNLGSEGLRDTAEKSAEYGRRLALLAPLADRFNDQMAELSLQSKETGLSIATGILPGLIGMATWLSDIKAGGERAEQALQFLSEKSPLFKGLVEFNKLTGRGLALAGAGGDQGKRSSAGNIGGGAGDLASFDAATARFEREREAEKKAKSLLDKPAAAAGADRESSYLARLREQLNFASGDISEYSKQLLAISQGPAKDFSQTTKNSALALARQIDTLRAATKANEDHAKVLEKVSRAEDSATKAMDDFAFKQDQNVAGIAARTAALGKDPFEIKQAEAARAIQKDYEDAVKKINEELGKIGDIEGISERTYQLSQQRDKALADTASALDAEKARLDALNASWEYGADTALRKYSDELANVAATVEGAMTRAFRGMEDALVNFVKTGKLDFKSLADSIITDLIRIQVQQSITKPLANAINSSGGFGGLLSSAGGFVKSLFGFADGGSFTVGGGGGTDSQLVAFRATPGEQVSIATPAQQGSRGNAVVINQNISIDSRSDQATIVQAMVAAKNAAISEIHSNMRRGGVFA